MTADREFDDAASEYVLRRAIEIDAERDRGLTESDVRSIAQELGVAQSSVDEAIAELDHRVLVLPFRLPSKLLDLPRPGMLRWLSAFAGLLAAGVAGISKLTLDPHRGTDYGAIGLLVLLAPLLVLMLRTRGPRRHFVFQTCNVALWLGFIIPMLMFFPEVADITIRGGPIYFVACALLGALTVEAQHRLGTRQLSAFAAVLLVLAAPLQAQSQPERVTVPLMLEANRPFITITFRRPDGSTRSARFLVDTGGGAFLMTEPLARDIGLEWGTPIKEEGAEFARVKNLPQPMVGTFPLELNPQRVFVRIGGDNVLPNATAGHADGMLPGHILARYHVVFDYPNATFTLAQPGVLTPKGDPLPMPVSKTTGFPRTEIDVNGTKYGLLLDTGASFTMVSEVLLKTWGSEHPEWPRHPGAFGEAATLGGTTLETMFVPRGLWLSHPLDEFGVVSQREGTFERYMSGMMAAPIVGSLAGNVLKRFRIELDYANEKLYISEH